MAQISCRTGLGLPSSAATPHVQPGAGHDGFTDRARWIEVWSPLAAG